MSVNVLGRSEPRLFTPPLRELHPGSSIGFKVIDFAERIGWSLRPWQQWKEIHAGELLEDGTPRFRTLLTVVGRQNGKTVNARVKTLWWLFEDLPNGGPYGEPPLVMGTSTSRDTAKDSWRKTVQMAEKIPELAAELAEKHTRETIGEEVFFTNAGCEFRFAAPNRRAGRARTVRRAILDELREHQTHDAYDAVMGAANAVPDAQIEAITNQGDATAVVLAELRASALRYASTGEGDDTTFIAEWSVPDDCDDPTDLEALAYSNPDLNRGQVTSRALLALARRAQEAGGDQLQRFWTEYGCRTVVAEQPAIDPASWEGGHAPGDLVGLRTALVWDLSPDLLHGSVLAAAVLPDGRVRVVTVDAFEGAGAGTRLMRQLPVLVARTRARVVGWLPGGPAAALASEMKPRIGWPPIGIRVEEIRAETAAVCMGFAEAVKAGLVTHPVDPLLDAHVGGSEQLSRANGQWVFSRRGGHCDAVYAAAGAVWLARTLRAPTGKPRLVVAD